MKLKTSKRQFLHLNSRTRRKLPGAVYIYHNIIRRCLGQFNTTDPSLRSSRSYSLGFTPGWNHSWCCAGQLWYFVPQVSFGFGHNDRQIRYRMLPNVGQMWARTVSLLAASQLQQIGKLCVYHIFCSSLRELIPVSYLQSLLHWIPCYFWILVLFFYSLFRTL